MRILYTKKKIFNMYAFSIPKYIYIILNSAILNVDVSENID